MSVTSSPPAMHVVWFWLQGPGLNDLSCSAMAQRMRAERPRQQARRAWLADLMGECERGRGQAASWGLSSLVVDNSRS